MDQVFIAFGTKFSGYDKVPVRAEAGEGRVDLITGEAPDVEFNLT